MEGEVLIAEAVEQSECTFLATVTAGGYSRTRVDVRSPFSPEEEKELLWYCEWSDGEAFEARQHALAVEESLKRYGTELFEMVFGSDPPPLPEGATIRVRGGPRFCALHWELLADPRPGGGPVVLDKNRFLIRDASRPVQTAPLGRSGNHGNHQHQHSRDYHSRDQTQWCERLSSHNTLNVLFLTARSRVDELDIPLRVTSLAVMKPVRKQDLPLRFDLVRPGTRAALERRLEDRGAGFYHILHFDCHGRGGECEGDGMEAGLVLESEAGLTQVVTASDIADIVARYRIPIVFTSACRSGYGLSSLAHALFAGSNVECVVAMGMAILLDTAAQFVGKFYLAMFESRDNGNRGVTVRGAIGRARCLLNSDRKRRGKFRRTIVRHDWWIPQLYERCSSAAPREYHFERCDWSRREWLAEDMRDEKNFAGRDGDLHQLEGIVYSQERTDNVVLLHGMMGCGKTAFLDYVSWWWCVTGLTVGRFVFRMDIKAYTVQDIIHEIYMHLRIVPMFYPTALGVASELDAVTRLLRSRCYVIVLDGAERLSTQPQKVTTDFADWLGDLYGGKTIVLVGSREKSTNESRLFERAREKSIGDDFATNLTGFPSKELRAFSKRASEKFARLKLDLPDGEQSSRNRIFSTRAMRDVLSFGNPLVIDMVLDSALRGTGDGNLCLPSAEELAKPIYEFLAGSPYFSPPSPSWDAAIASMRLSFNRLSCDEQQALLFLRPFKGSVTRKCLEMYACNIERRLQEPEWCERSVVKFNRSAWHSSLNSAERLGLLTAHDIVYGGNDEDRKVWRLHPCLPILLKRTLLERAETLKEGSNCDCGVLCSNNAVLCIMLSARHDAYSRWALELYDYIRATASKERMLGLALTELEYWNLESVLKYALERRKGFYGILLPLHWYHAERNDVSERLILCRLVVSRMELNNSVSEDACDDVYLRDVPRAYHLYGLVLAASAADSGEAEVWFERAKAFWDAKGANTELAITMHELGWVAMKVGDFPRAEQCYKRALELSSGQHRAKTLHNMGLLEMLKYRRKTLSCITESPDGEKYHLETAERFFKDALELYKEGKEHDTQAIASSYHHLAIVDMKKGQLQDAEENGVEALKLRKQNDNASRTANSLQVLGNLALRQAWASTSAREREAKLKAAKEHYSEALLKYERDAARENYSTPERDMLYENFGLLMATCATFAATHAERERFRNCEMDSYNRVCSGPFPKALYNLGLCYEERGEYDKALRCYEEAAATPVCKGNDSFDEAAHRAAKLATETCPKNRHEAVQRALLSRGQKFDERIFSNEVIE